MSADASRRVRPILTVSTRAHPTLSSLSCFSRTAEEGAVSVFRLSNGRSRSTWSQTILCESSERRPLWEQADTSRLIDLGHPLTDQRVSRFRSQTSVYPLFSVADGVSSLRPILIPLIVADNDQYVKRAPKSPKDTRFHYDVSPLLLICMHLSKLDLKGRRR